jgi:hypothetical protein
MSLSVGERVWFVGQPSGFGQGILSGAQGLPGAQMHKINTGSPSQINGCPHNNYASKPSHAPTPLL